MKSRSLSSVRAPALQASAKPTVQLRPDQLLAAATARASSENEATASYGHMPTAR